MLDLLVTIENQNFSPTFSEINKTQQELQLTEIVSELSLMQQHLAEKKIFIELQETEAELGAAFYPKVTPLGASVITIDCVPDYEYCLLEAVHHELGHYVDIGDSQGYDLLDKRLNMPDAQEFNTALENISLSYEEFVSARNELNRFRFCDYLSIIDEIQDEISVEAPQITYLKNKHGCSSYVLEHSIVLGRVHGIKLDTDSVHHDLTGDSTKEHHADSNYFSNYQTLRESLSDEEHKLLSFANSIRIQPPSQDIAHDKKPRERFAAAVHSLMTQYVGPVVWGPLKFTLTDDLLEYFATYEFEGEKIFSESVEKYKRDQKYREYWENQ